MSSDRKQNANLNPSPNPASISPNPNPASIRGLPIRPSINLPLSHPAKPCAISRPFFFASILRPSPTPRPRHHGCAHHPGIPHSLAPRSAHIRQVPTAHEALRVTLCAAASPMWQAAWRKMRTKERNIWWMARLMGDLGAIWRICGGQRRRGGWESRRKRIRLLLAFGRQASSASVRSLALAFVQVCECELPTRPLPDMSPASPPSPSPPSFSAAALASCPDLSASSHPLPVSSMSHPPK